METMASKKIAVTRTFGPLHFEDLDPHRFEDLVRELIYDFRDWQSIEATGRSGNDQGFDVRAFERATGRLVDEEDADSADVHPMDGNQWMIQGKREKELGPSAVKKILQDVSADDPPYGYILAASAVFSKESYDLFREELRAKGVMEFYLWGRPELEDMLHLPKNDRILFTFFGISLVSRRRSRTTEIRSAITIKNKLYKLLGQPDIDFYSRALLRDMDDTNYPFKKEYPDFADRPRWFERVAFSHHPRGVMFHDRERYAYIDWIKKEWDYTPFADLLWPNSQSDKVREAQQAAQSSVRETWDYFPRLNQAKLAVDGMLPYDRISVIDTDGDALHRCPHIYTEFSGETPPFLWRRGLLSGVCGKLDPDDDEWTRVPVFPQNHPKERRITLREDRLVELDAQSLTGFLGYKDDAATLFAADDRYADLEPRDVVFIAGTPDEHALRITFRGSMKFSEIPVEYQDAWKLQRFAAQQLGRTVEGDEQLNFVETERIYRHDWEGGHRTPEFTPT